MQAPSSRNRRSLSATGPDSAFCKVRHLSIAPAGERKRAKTRPQQTGGIGGQIPVSVVLLEFGHHVVRMHLSAGTAEAPAEERNGLVQGVLDF